MPIFSKYCWENKIILSFKNPCLICFKFTERSVVEIAPSLFLFKLFPFIYVTR